MIYIITTRGYVASVWPTLSAALRQSRASPRRDWFPRGSKIVDRSTGQQLGWIAKSEDWLPRVSLALITRSARLNKGGAR